MIEPRTTTRFGRIYAPDEAWLGKAPREPILEPDLPIIDTHHHLWDRPDHRYLLHELLTDLRAGHNVVATVFLQCHAMYRAAGAEELRPVGETEFVAGIAAMSDSGGYGTPRIAAGIVGYADLTLGERVEPVLEAQIRAGGGRFRGVRHSGNWDADPIIGNGAPGPDIYRRADFRAGLARLTALGLSLDAWVFHTQLADVIDFSRHQHHHGPCRWGAGLRPLFRQTRRGVRLLEGIGYGTGEVPERDDEAGRHDDAGCLVRL
jgi:Amidohydrolase